MDNILQLLYNMGALIAISIISGFISLANNREWLKWASQGILFGVTSIIGMINPLVLAPGLIFDGRSVMLSLCGMFFGPKAVALAATMALIFRIYRGGVGTIMGICVIISSSLIGVFFYNRQGEHDRVVSVKQLLFLGIIVHVIMLLLMSTLPEGRALATLKLLGIPIMLAYPIVTVLIGKILSEANNIRIITEKLRISEINLLKTNEELEASFEEVSAQEEEIRDQYFQLTKSQKRFKSIFDQAPIGIFLANKKTGTITHANKKYIEIMSCDSEEPIGKDWNGIINLLDIDDEKSRKSHRNSDLLEYRKRFIKPDDSFVWVDLKIVRDIETGEDEYDEMCFVEDISSKKETEDALALSEYNFRTIFNSSTDAILILKDDEIIDCNKAGAKLLGNGLKESILGKKIFEFSPKKQPDGQLSKVKVRKMIKLSRKNLYYRFEWTHEKFDGSQIIVEIILTPIMLNGVEVSHVLIRDIAERKKMEEQLEYLSYRDRLTGLYNRRFFEEELNRLDVKRNLPLTIMMGDVNGLKLVNDSFGHAIGDQLLKTVASILKKECRADDIISRIGGDEFVIIIPKAGEKEVESIAKRIQNSAKKEKMKGLEISVSFGWETKVLEKEKISDVLKAAEDYLYKKKLFESPSMRSSNIQTIIHTLYEKNKREEQHSQRVSKLCEEMGITRGMLDVEIKELRSLGLLHDIGKIAIDERVLNKEGKLNESEWSEIKKHPEIGYRILRTVNEMSEMAEYVLSHHERWDGNGYPRGLKGEEIPLKARIISIADAFDAMTSERTYRKTMTQNEALAEIEKNSGTQFDPQLVKTLRQMLNKNTDKLDI